MTRSMFVLGGAATAAAATMPVGADSIGADTAYDLTTPTGTIFGTLSVVSTPSKVPVVLIIAGSGPTDRDGNSPPALHSDTYKRLAASLVALGIAVLRYDKRGVGASLPAGPAEIDLRFDAYVGDAVAWVSRLRADSRFSKIAIAGHSEGSLIGMIAAQRAPVDALVSLDGAGFPADAVLRKQLRTQLAPYPDLAAQNDRILDALKAGTIPLETPAALHALYRPSVLPYLVSWFKYDPRVEIAKLRTNVTIVQGTNDVQVSVDDARALATANPSARLLLIEGMTHVLADSKATTVAEQAASVYRDPLAPIDPKVPGAIAAALR